MKTFEYSAFDAGGRRSRGLVEADGPKEAREKLAARGLLAESVRALDAAPAAGGPERRALRRVEVRALVYEELATILRAGLPLARALELLIGSPELAGCRADLAAVRDRIREGVGPAEALAATGAPAPFEVAVLEAGQRAGALDASLARLASFLEEQAKLRGRIVTALVYPSVVAALALLVAVGMLGFMLPRFARVWSEAQIDLPPFTLGVMAAGRVGVRFVLPAAALLAGAAWVARRRDRARGAAGGRLEAVAVRWPGIGPAWTALIAFRFARTLAVLLRGGVPLLDAMAMAGRATGHAPTARRVDEEVDSVRHGGGLAPALRRVPALAESLPGWVEAGEASGDLDRLLDAAAARCEQVWERRLTRAVALLEPALIVLMGAVVLVVALAILLPVIALNRSLAGAAP